MIKSQTAKPCGVIFAAAHPGLWAGLCVAAGLFLSFYLGWSLTRDRLLGQAEDNAQMRVLALQGMLTTQRAVATVISSDTEVTRALLDPAIRPDVSRKLEQLRVETGSAVIYLLDASGTAVAASNWDGQESFIGRGYAFRDYFNLAVKDGTGYQFTSGVVTKRPGLHLSDRVEKDGVTLGVVVVKIEFAPLQAAWTAASDETVVTANDGQIVLSSDPSSLGQRESLSDVFEVSKPIQEMKGWTLRVGASRAVAAYAGLASATVFLSLSAAIGLIMLRIVQRRRRDAERLSEGMRHRQALERAVSERTAALTAEIEERTLAERRLAELQVNLIQANKLATLGQVTAGVAHEVNQPLAAIRLLADTSLALAGDGSPGLEKNLSKIIGMTQRIEKITSSLRRFARKSGGHVVPLRLMEALDNSLLLTSTSPQAKAVRVIIEPFDRDLTVLAEAVPLEQILVNLITNGYEALASTEDGEIRISVVIETNVVDVFVADNGPGLAPTIEKTLFQPFATSKAGGVGLGLVIARDIARNMGGDLDYVQKLGTGGACFQLRLRRP